LKKSILVLILLLCTGLFSGCGSQGKKEITVMWWGDVYNYNFAKKLIASYNADNPVIPAKLIVVQGEYTYKLLAMAASKTLPDVVLVIAPDVYNMGSRGALLPLNKYTDTAKFKAVEEEMWPRLMASFNVDDKQLAVPIWTWTPGIYYNKDLFDMAGVPYPSRNWAFKEFEAKSRKLIKKENGKIKIYAHDTTFSLGDLLLLSYLYAHGGGLYTDDHKKCLINTPASVAALKAFSELRLKDHTAPKASEAAGMGNSGRNIDLFQSGSVSMHIAGRDYMDVLRQRGGSKFRWGVAPMPSGDKPSRFLVASSLAISANSKHPDEAWKFISFVTGEKGQKLITMDRSDITIFKKWAYGKDFLDYQSRPDVNVVFRDMLFTTVPMPYRIGDNEWKTRAGDHLALVELGKMSIEEACARIAADFKP